MHHVDERCHVKDYQGKLGLFFRQPLREMSAHIREQRFQGERIVVIFL